MSRKKQKIHSSKIIFFRFTNQTTNGKVLSKRRKKKEKILSAV
ncbi:50S ribosomal protein L34 [Halalkalibacter suaedae]